MECRMLLSTTTSHHQRHGLLLHYLADITLVSINYSHNEAITWNMAYSEDPLRDYLLLQKHKALYRRFKRFPKWGSLPQSTTQDAI